MNETYYEAWLLEGGRVDGAAPTGSPDPGQPSWAPMTRKGWSPWKRPCNIKSSNWFSNRRL